MDDLDFFEKLQCIEKERQAFALMTSTDPAEMIARHRIWLQSIRKERPLASVPYKVGIYIRYFNQTKYDNYLSYHKKQFADTIALCPKWTLVDFYIDEGASVPNMESASEWCRLLEDCLSGRVDLIITQKVSNVSKKPHEVTLISRVLAQQKPPVGIYFISEDIFTLATYYLEDMQDSCFFPENWTVLPETEEERVLLND